MFEMANNYAFLQKIRNHLTVPVDTVSTYTDPFGRFAIQVTWDKNKQYTFVLTEAEVLQLKSEEICIDYITAIMNEYHKKEFENEQRNNE